MELITSFSFVFVSKQGLSTDILLHGNQQVYIFIYFPLLFLGLESLRENSQKQYREDAPCVSLALEGMGHDGGACSIGIFRFDGDFLCS